jgi:hypothetical protein
VTKSETKAKIAFDMLDPDRSRVIGIEGLREGDATLFAADPGSSLRVQMDLNILPLLWVSVMFYRLTDQAGHGTKRPSAVCQEMLNGTSAIHGQEEVSFDLRGTQDVVLPGDQGDVPRASVLIPILEGLFSGSDGGAAQLDRCRAALHVFLVWNMNSDDSGGGGTSALGTTRWQNNLMFIKDFAGDSKQVLAHKIGHYLLRASQGENDHHPDIANLMYAFGLLGGTLLTRGQCLRMHRNAGWVPSEALEECK